MSNLFFTFEEVDTMNNCSFLGRMGKDPKFYAGDGNKKSYIQFSIAVKRAFAQQGQPDTDWFDMKAYGKTAELINTHVPTGRQLGVVAHAAVEEWTEQQTGAKRRRTVFIVDSLTFCDGKGEGGSASGASASQQNSAPYTPPTMNYEEEDDLPF